VKTLANELSFMRGRCIGLLGGNHYMSLDNGDTTDHLLSAALGTKYLGVCGGIILSVRLKGSGKSATLHIWAHHGKGGGTLAGATFNTVEKFSELAEGDVFLMGHDHRRGIVPKNPKLRLVHNTRTGGVGLKAREIWLGRTGSFLKAYEPGRVSYNVDAARSPSSLGWVELEITPVRKQVDRKPGRRGEDVLELQIRGTA
jgi:hypothetical protein